MERVCFTFAAHFYRAARLRWLQVLVKMILLKLFNKLSANCTCHKNGRGPPMILSDLSRNHEDIDYETIEKGKDGKFFNSK